MIRRLPDVYYLPIEGLRKADPHLDSFLNVNTPEDLEIVERRLRSRR